jgi:hypothetical protein
MFSTLDIQDSCFFSRHEAAIQEGLAPVQFGLGVQGTEHFSRICSHIPWSCHSWSRR